MTPRIAVSVDGALCSAKKASLKVVSVYSQLAMIEAAFLPFWQTKRGAFQGPLQPKCRAVDIYSLLKNLKCHFGREKEGPSQPKCRAVVIFFVEKPEAIAVSLAVRDVFKLLLISH